MSRLEQERIASLRGKLWLTRQGISLGRYLAPLGGQCVPARRRAVRTISSSEDSDVWRMASEDSVAIDALDRRQSFLLIVWLLTRVRNAPQIFARHLTVDIGSCLTAPGDSPEIPANSQISLRQRIPP